MIRLALFNTITTTGKTLRLCQPCHLAMSQGGKVKASFVIKPLVSCDKCTVTKRKPGVVAHCAVRQ